MATSSIPAAIDYLVTAITALPECAAPVVVSDGWPDRRATTGVGIGVTTDDTRTDDQPIHAALGGQMERENYLIPCTVWSRAAVAPAMKTARDSAFTIFNAVVTKIRADRTLGGALHSGAAIATDVQIRQDRTSDAAGDGRICEITFNVQCENRF